MNQQAQGCGAPVFSSWFRDMIAYNISMDTYRDTLTQIISDYRSYQPEDRDAGEVIQKAFEFSQSAHQDIIRKS